MSLILNDVIVSRQILSSALKGRYFIKREFSLEASAKNFLDIIKPYMKKQ